LHAVRMETTMKWGCFEVNHAGSRDESHRGSKHLVYACECRVYRRNLHNLNFHSLATKWCRLPSPLPSSFGSPIERLGPLECHCGRQRVVRVTLDGAESLQRTSRTLGWQAKGTFEGKKAKEGIGRLPRVQRTKMNARGRTQIATLPRRMPTQHV